MDEQAFREKLTELMDKIKQLPGADQPEIEQLANETAARHERIRAAVGELQDSLDHLRLSVKYLVFDLEATRRENTYLRKMMEQANRDEASQDAEHDEPDEYYDPDEDMD